jgi:hypothetical protein
VAGGAHSARWEAALRPGRHNAITSAPSSAPCLKIPALPTECSRRSVPTKAPRLAPTRWSCRASGTDLLIAVRTTHAHRGAGDPGDARQTQQMAVTRSG